MKELEFLTYTNYEILCFRWDYAKWYGSTNNDVEAKGKKLFDCKFTVWS